jgi:hypothetical protein
MINIAEIRKLLILNVSYYGLVLEVGGFHDKNGKDMWFNKVRCFV